MQHTVSNLLLSTPLPALRKGTRLTQEQAGSSVGLLPKTISALENNSHTVSIISLLKLVSALDMELTLQLKSGEQQGAW
ncbi:MAG: helix-turn-helix domain-containing protein [Proteobacteria bacterium]|nr:helix-turn-helix domain-containing protein [Pseudomonadota bacterium]